jgi:2-aminoethylphosphonate-pyruvate transaminase
MEAALASTVPADGKVLIIDNGAFGARLVEVASVHSMNIVHMRYDWGERVMLADVERAFAEHPDICVVAMIHHETSVGLLNPVREIGALCKKTGALLIVDAVSSLGAEDIDVVRDNIDVCYASANKCLHAVSGASFMCVAPRVWERVEQIVPRSYYLDLRRYRRYMDELAQTPFTPAVSIYYALDAACAEFLADGHEARFESYRTRNKQLRAGLSALGMTPFTATGDESNSIVTCKLPEGVAFGELYEAVKARGVVLYGCKGVLADEYMQIANMGYLPETAIDDFLEILADELGKLRAKQPAVGRASRSAIQARG